MAGITYGEPNVEASFAYYDDWTYTEDTLADIPYNQSSKYRLESKILLNELRKFACGVSEYVDEDGIRGNFEAHLPNISYTPRYYPLEKSNALLKEFLEYPFERVKLKIKGRVCTPLRQICAFSDPDVYYSFSGTTIRPKPWTPKLLEVKSELEKFTGCQFNYVLLNLYPDGRARIGAHMDNEPDLDPTAAIATLSFGAKRIMKFTTNYLPIEPSIDVPLRHGSLLMMYSQEWFHSIDSDPNVTEPRISLTFRKIRPTSRCLTENS